eukprot:8704809-Prorocentrum_lima.AAC.1
MVFGVVGGSGDGEKGSSRSGDLNGGVPFSMFSVGGVWGTILYLLVSQSSSRSRSMSRSSTWTTSIP